MAPPGIIGRSKGLYPSQPLTGRNGRIRQWLGGLWNDAFSADRVGPTPGGGAATAATGVPHRAPNSVMEYLFGEAPAGQMPFQRGLQPFPRGGASPFPGPSRGTGLGARQQSPLYAQSMQGMDMEALVSGLERQFGSSLNPSMRAERDGFIGGAQVPIPNAPIGPPSETPTLLPDQIGRQPVGPVNLMSKQQSPLYSQSMLPSGSPDLMSKRQMPLYSQSQLPALNTQLLNGQGPLQRFGREGLSPLFNAPPQSPYRPGSAPGGSVLGAGEMAAQDAIQSMIDQIRGDREALRGGRMRQEELRQGQFDQNWSEYARQAPLMNQYQSPQFGQTNQGLGPGGVAPMTPEEQAYMRRRNAYTDQPGTDQMYNRFGAGPLTGEALQGFAPSAFNNDYDGQVRMQPGGYGSPLSGPLGKSRDPEFSDEAVARRQTERKARIKADQDLPGGGSSRLRDATARRDAWREANGMRASTDIMGRRADRDAARAATLQNQQAQNLSRRGISPLSPEGQSLAPDLYTSIQNRRRGVIGGAAGGSGSPLTTPDGTPVTPVAKGAPQNPTTREQARTASHAMLAQRPVFRSIGLDAGAGPDEMPSPSEVVQGLNSAVLQSGAGLTDDDLKDLHEYAVQVAAAAPPNEKPFSAGGLWSPPDAPEDQWNELATLPSNDAKGRRDWWDRYKAKHLSTRPKPPGGDVGNSSWSSPLQGQIF